MQVRVDDFEKGKTPRKIVASLRRGKNRSVTVKKLAERTGVSQATVRRRVSEMVEVGIMKRTSIVLDEDTGREVYTYSLTG